MTGRIAYGSARSGTSSEDAVYQLMVCVGPEVTRLLSPAQTNHRHCHYLLRYS